MTAARTARIHELLATALHPAALKVDDESHLHVGHAGARGGAGHFRIHIVAEQFQGLRPLQRHRLVYDVLQSMMPTEIHALSIEASAPDERSIHDSSKAAKEAL
jgi:BolA protein